MPPSNEEALSTALSVYAKHLAATHSPMTWSECAGVGTLGKCVVVVAVTFDDFAELTNALGRAAYELNMRARGEGRVKPPKGGRT